MKAPLGSTFSDEDLKRLKAIIHGPFDPHLSVVENGHAFDLNLNTLLARLEAAEDLILNHTITPIGYDDRYKAWLRSKGEL